MTQKERKLLTVTGGLFAIMMIYMVVQWLVIGSIIVVRNDVAGLREKKQQLARQAEAEGTYRRLWTQLAGRTLASDPGTAKTLTLPNHPHIKGSTLRTICTQAGITRADFLRAYDQA